MNSACPVNSLGGNQLALLTFASTLVESIREPIRPKNGGVSSSKVRRARDDGMLTCAFWGQSRMDSVMWPLGRMV